MSEYVTALLNAARELLGTREGPHNSGPIIDAWNAAVHSPPGSPWCAAFVYHVHEVASERLGLPNACVRTGSSHSLWTSSDPARRTQLPAPGDVFVLDHGGGLGHCGIVETVAPDGRTVTSLEGNSNEAGSREGTSVVRHTWKPGDGKRGTLLGYVSFDPTACREYQEAMARGEA